MSCLCHTEMCTLKLIGALAASNSGPNLQAWPLSYKLEVSSSSCCYMWPVQQRKTNIDTTIVQCLILVKIEEKWPKHSMSAQSEHALGAVTAVCL